MDSQLLGFLNTGKNVLSNENINELVPDFVVKKAEKLKKLKDDRLARCLIIADQESCENIVSKINSVLTKELQVKACHEGKSLKKNKKVLVAPFDIIVGTVSRINELLEKIDLSNIKQFVVCNLDSTLENNKDAMKSVSAKLKDVTFQFIAMGSSKNSVEFIKATTNGEYETVKSQESEDSDDSDDSSEDSEKEVKVNGKSSSKEVKTDNGKSSDEDEDSDEDDEDEKKEEMEVEDNDDESSDSDEEEDVKKESEESSDSDEKGVEKETPVETSKTYEMDNEVLKKVENAKNFEKYNEMAKKLLLTLSDEECVAKLLSLVCTQGSNNNSTAPKKSSGEAPVTHTSGSKLSGREGYTAYHLKTNQECMSKGYLYKSLKRLIPEEVVELMERVQMQEDKMGFVFDIVSEHDDCIQSNWKDGKYDTLELLETVPALQQYDDSNRGNRPSFGGRGGRGGERGGRGGNRGGDRGGRGGNRGGYKRPFNGADGGSNSKMQKF